MVSILFFFNFIHTLSTSKKLEGPPIKWANASTFHSFLIYDAISILSFGLEPPTPYVTEIKSGFNFFNSFNTSLVFYKSSKTFFGGNVPKDKVLFF